MKILLALLLLIPNLSWGHHEDSFKIDAVTFSDEYGQINIYVYNQTSEYIGSHKYLWLVTFDDNSSRVYRTSDSSCEGYTNCTWLITGMASKPTSVVPHHQ